MSRRITLNKHRPSTEHFDHRRRALRAFIALAAVGVTHRSWPSIAGGEEAIKPWICSTPVFATRFDRLRPSPSGQNFFTYDENEAIILNESLAFIPAMDFWIEQLARKEDAWLVEHGLSGSNPDRILLGVRFLNGSTKQTDQVREAVKSWTADSRVPVKFVFQASGHQPIRISFQGNNSSEVGRQALKVMPSQPTIRLADVTDHEPETDHEWRHRRSVILHEFGHALGLRHEHRHPHSGIDWNKKKIVAAYTALGMSTEDVYKNVLKSLDASYMCHGAPEFDPKSIMIYQIHEGWDKNGFTTPAPSEIREADFKCIASLYS